MVVGFDITEKMGVYAFVLNLSLQLTTTTVYKYYILWEKARLAGERWENDQRNQPNRTIFFWVFFFLFHLHGKTRQAIQVEGEGECLSD